MRADTLPRRPEASARRWGPGLLALAGSLVLLAGVPVALVMLVGNPLPSTAPSRDWLTAEVTPAFVIDVLAVMVWVVWTHFVVCFLAEWRAVRAGRMPSQVAFGGGSQVVARQLVAGLLMLSGGAGIAQGLTALTAEPVPAAPSVTMSAVVVEQAPETVLDVRDDAQVQKVLEVRVPEGRNHDTLWDIAERSLGDPFQWKQIFELNKGRLMADGERLTDADLIRPGWTLLMPDHAKGPDVRIVQGPGAASQAGGRHAATPTAGADASAVSAGETGSETGSETGTVTGAEAADEAGDQAGGGVDGDRRSGLAELLLGGGLVLAGVVRALTVRRGPFGEPDEDAAELAVAADLQRAELVDDALRALAEMRRAQGEEMPEVLFVYASDEQVVLHLAAPCPAPERPWTTSEDGRSWSLHADELVKPGATTHAPYPSLVNVAHSHGFDLLVDLEMAPGLVAIGGHVETAREVAMSLAVDLATHAWSDDVAVFMVGFGDELADLSGGRITSTASLDEALTRAERDDTATGRVAAALGLTGVLQGRQHDASGAYHPVVVFMSGSPTAEEAQRIARLTGNGRTRFSAVCVGDSPSARWRFVVDQSSALEAPVLGVGGTARRLTRPAQAQLTALLAAADRQRSRGEQRLATTPVAGLAEEAAVPVAAPVAEASGRVDLDTAPVAVRLLGPVEVEAHGHVDPARRPLLTELVVMAALHPEGLHEAVLAASLWPRGVEADVVAARLGDAQQWVGAGRLRKGDDGRWHLDAATDYAVLARAARTDSLPELLAALRLGDGEAFSGAGQHYSWLAFAREARTCRLLVASVAQRAAELAVAAGRVDDAAEALRLGLVLVPTAEVLWRLLLRLTAQHDPAALDAAITEMYSVLSRHGVRHEPETDALVGQLAPAYGGAVGS